MSVSVLPKLIRKTLVHDHVRRANFITTPRYSLCVDILLNTLPREITDVTSDVSTCKGYPWVSKLLLPPQRLSLGIPMKKTMIEK